MTTADVKKQIKTGNLLPLYIFTGEEIKAQDIYIQKMSEASGKEVVSVDAVSDIFKRRGGFFAVSRIYVCLGDREFMKAEKSWENLKNSLGNDTLIIRLSDADKRTKFYKKFQDDIVEFGHMSTETLTRYIQRDIKLSVKACEVLCEICENDYCRILSEVDKIKQYQSATLAQNADSAFKTLLDEGAIYIPPEDAIFKFTDAVLMHRKNDAMRLVAECQAIGEPALRLVSVLYSNVRRVLQVQACESKDISKATGLSAWDIKCVRDKLNMWSDGDLVYMLKLLRYVDKSIKTGAMEEATAMDYILVNIF